MGEQTKRQATQSHPSHVCWRETTLSAIRCQLISHGPDEYQIDTATALALRPRVEVGLHLRPWERVRYLIRHAKAANTVERRRVFPRLGLNDGFDVVPYQRLLLDAALELLDPFRL